MSLLEVDFHEGGDTDQDRRLLRDLPYSLETSGNDESVEGCKGCDSRAVSALDRVSLFTVRKTGKYQVV